ncbi:MAG TPA: ABC transporter ATP-binding protein [Candidatus Ornithomonoglobus merdipullorum]|uniref:ABC transporter ATP-binding protein n=1 Tax=Candidatus Ornithomonoglobus merdipullorum TaxID=2840895 RepID=A0A9D1MAY0_9FIRM|nr:ABC transporter ATP-binding protein [Candidatus Ornithomonoglobus merdipullorum]
MIKKLMKSIREYKRESILTPVIVILEVFMEILIPFLMATLIDHIEAGQMDKIVQYGIVLIICAALALLFGGLAGKYAATASAGFAKNLRFDMFKKVQGFSFANIDHFSTGGIVTRLTTDVTNLQNAYQMIIRIAVRSPFTMICALIMAFVVNQKLSLIYLIIIPVLGFILYQIMTHAHPIFEKMFHVYDVLNDVIQENLHGIRVVKSFVREKHEEEKFNKQAEGIYDYSTKAEKLLAFNAPAMQFCIYTCMIVIFWFGSKFIVGGELTTGQLTSMFTYTMQILMSLMMLSMVFVMITMARSSAERISELLDTESDIKDPEKPVTEVKNGDIFFDHVTFAYKGHAPSLRNIQLEIPSGTTVGIIGGTGSGKSSLVQLIPRLYDTTEGRVTVGGVNVKKYDLEVLRNSVAMVLQKNVLFSGTIKENMRWGNENATDEEIAAACHAACADEFIDTFPQGYDTYIEQGGTNVSGGQRQRLCIARALLKKPKILILDDSTSAVDTKTDATIREAMQNAIPGATKIIIAQRISSVEHADMIIVMNEGRIDGIGTHEELLKSNEIYKEIYDSQVKGGEDNE